MERILIYQTAFLGDLLLSIPLIKNVRSEFPDAEIHLACRAPLGDFFKSLQLVHVVHEVQKGNSQSRARFERELCAISWAQLYCVHRSTRSMFLAMRIKAKIKIGFYKWWSAWIFTHTVAYDRTLPDALRQLSLLTPIQSLLQLKIKDLAKVKRPLPEWASMKLKEIPLSPAWAEWLQIPAPWVFISPGSQWATKRWTLQGFKEIAQRELANGSRIIAVGSKSERELIEQMEIDHERFHNLAGETSLTHLLALFQRGDVLVSNDSGSMHLASCAGLPTVAVFGPTVLEFGYEPWQDRAAVVEKKMGCRPCGRHGHQICPIGTHACMKEISSVEVSAQMDQLRSSTF